MFKENSNPLNQLKDKSNHQHHNYLNINNNNDPHLISDASYGSYLNPPLSSYQNQFHMNYKHNKTPSSNIQNNIKY